MICRVGYEKWRSDKYEIFPKASDIIQSFSEGSTDKLVGEIEIIYESFSHDHKQYHLYSNKIFI